ncbi:hypothetical protein JL720_593 [Aureococcus anophagefferens]|nr:hypothetical protein JL720_593 [Aureococcus anophagefferens]
MLDAASAERAAALASAADGHRRLLETAVDGHDAAFAEAVAERAVEMSATNDVMAYAARKHDDDVRHHREAHARDVARFRAAHDHDLERFRAERASADATHARRSGAARARDARASGASARCGGAAASRTPGRRGARFRRRARGPWARSTRSARRSTLAAPSAFRAFSAWRRAAEAWRAEADRAAILLAIRDGALRRLEIAARDWSRTSVADGGPPRHVEAVAAHAAKRAAYSKLENALRSSRRRDLGVAVERWRGEVRAKKALTRLQRSAASRLVYNYRRRAKAAAARRLAWKRDVAEADALTKLRRKAARRLRVFLKTLEASGPTDFAVHAVERGASELRGSLENVELCRGALHKRGGMLKTGKKIFHRHAWKEKTFVLRARRRPPTWGPCSSSRARARTRRYALDGCGVRGFEKPATIWAGSEPRDAFRFDVVERSGAIKSLYAPTAADRDRWLGAVREALSGHHVVAARLAVLDPAGQEARDAAVEALRREADDAPLGFAAADELAKGIADVERDVDNTDFLRTGLCGVVIHGGFLIHKRKKRRYFKVRAVAFDDAGAYVGPRLEYAVEEDDDVVLGTYLLDGARVEAGEGSGFDLRYDHGTVALVAASAEDRSEWLLALEEALSQHHDIVEALRRRSGPAPRGRSPATPRRSPKPLAEPASPPDSPALFRFGVGRPADEFQCEFQSVLPVAAPPLAADVCAVEDRGDEAARRRLAGAVSRRGPLSVADGGTWRRAACSLAAATFTAAGDYAGPALLEECGGRVVATPLADRVARPCDPSGWDLEPAAAATAVLRGRGPRGPRRLDGGHRRRLAGHGRVLAALGRGRAPKTPLTHDEAIRRALEAAEHRYAKTEPNKKYGPRLYSPFQDPREFL